MTWTRATFLALTFLCVLIEPSVACWCSIDPQELARWSPVIAVSFFPRGSPKVVSNVNATRASRFPQHFPKGLGESRKGSRPLWP